MELPIYHGPDIKTIMMVVWSRTLSFIRKAGTVILNRRLSARNINIAFFEHDLPGEISGKESNVNFNPIL